MGLYSRTLKLTPAGAAGSAAAQGFIRTLGPGKLYAVRVDYTSQPATTDVTITNLGRAVLSLSNANTDGVFRPREQEQTTAGANTTDQPHVVPPVDGQIQIDVAQGDPVADGVVITLIIEG